ncbi:hypothetical protein GCM10020366_53840 [Saccharopolyspora gregorii]|uniref:Uncharacterized protein n=1 Tax=Saccharopolyspora gregorii TaxID=33914 RepID=A0ABP6RY61_9PSEU
MQAFIHTLPHHAHRATADASLHSVASGDQATFVAHRRLPVLLDARWDAISNRKDPDRQHPVGHRRFSGPVRPSDKYTFIQRGPVPAGGPYPAAVRQPSRRPRGVDPKS